MHVTSYKDVSVTDHFDNSNWQKPVKTNVFGEKSFLLMNM